MRRFFLLSVLTFLTCADVGFCQDATTSGETGIDYERLATTDGEVYFNVKIRKIEPDSLIVEHRNGAARISFFDLPDEIRDSYGFDADRAMAHYKARDERLRALRKQQFHEKLLADAKLAEAAKLEAHENDVRQNWIPARARIIEVGPAGALAYVERITMERQPTKTALGGEGLPGPPKASYSRLSRSPVILKGLQKNGRGSVKAGSVWTGYVIRDPHDATLDQRKEDAPLVYRATVLSR